MGWERGPGPSHSPGGARGDSKGDGLKQRAEMQAQLGAVGQHGDAPGTLHRSRTSDKQKKGEKGHSLSK